MGKEFKRMGMGEEETNLLRKCYEEWEIERKRRKEEREREREGRGEEREQFS